jgi:hypothetical protein
VAVAPTVAASKPVTALARQDSPLERIETELEFKPDDVELLEQAARAAAEDDDKDTALWYAKMARDLAVGDSKQKKRVKALDEFMLGLGAPESGSDALLDEYAKEVFALARTCERRKLYANAVDLLVRCKGTRYEKEARKKLEKLYGNKKAVEALLASGIEIPEKPATKKDPAWIIKEDAKHSSWDKAWEVEGKNYTIITNVGYEMAHLIHDAMDQMNIKLRSVFKYKERGGGMRRCVIKVYKTQEEFMEKEEIDSRSTLGFFSPGQFYIVTFDPRSGGGSLTELWDTLFHEVAHQFKHSVTTNLLPGWGNEGMACYFEGARLLASGSVKTNLVPESRLKDLQSFIKAGTPTVRETITYFEPGSYDGKYYPMGWGLMYYLLNYENEKSERIYVPIYKAWWETYTGGKKHDVQDRWEEYFIAEANIPGISTLKEFESHWHEWITELGSVHNGGPEQADKMIERARKQIANGFPENALESYEIALEKRPSDPVALHELAKLQLSLEHMDSGMYNLRRLLSMSRGQVDAETAVEGMDQSWEELASEVIATMTEVDKHVGKGSAESGATFAASILTASVAFSEAGYPRNAMYLLQNANTVLGGDGRLTSRITEIGSEEQVNLERWRRLLVPDDLEGWEASPDYSVLDGGNLSVNTGRMASASRMKEMPEDYRYEVWIEPKSGGDGPVYGLVLGSNHQTGLRIFAYLPNSGIAGLFTLKGGPVQLKLLKKPKLEDEDILRFAVEVSGRDVKFFLNDQDLGSTKLRPDHVRGGVGAFVQDGEAIISEMRVRF